MMLCCVSPWIIFSLFCVPLTKSWHLHCIVTLCCYTTEADSAMAWSSWPQCRSSTWSRRQWLDAARSLRTGLRTSTTAWQVSLVIAVDKDRNSGDYQWLKCKIAFNAHNPGANNFIVTYSDLMQCDLSDQDYELLLQLDKSASYLLLLDIYFSTQPLVQFILACLCCLVVATNQERIFLSLSLTKQCWLLVVNV